MNNHKNIFQVSLLLATFIPIIFFTLFSQLKQPNLGVEAVNYTLLFLGTAHVPTTAFFYNLQEFRDIILKNKIRYIYIPFTLFLISGCIFTFSNNFIKPYLLLFYWSWQAYHYGRQNLGVYSFISYAQTSRPAYKLEKLSINLGTLAGILPTWKVLGFNVAPSYLHDLINFLYSIGYFVFLAAFFLSIYIFVIYRANFTLLKSLFLFLSVFFFIPIYFSGPLSVTFLSYAIAHGIQYIIFMSVIAMYYESPVTETISKNKKDQSLKYNLLQQFFLLFVYLVIGGILFFHAPDLKSFQLLQNQPILLACVDFMVGGILGLTMGHFVVDAHAWKLSQVSQRQFILKRFSFIFKG